MKVLVLGGGYEQGGNDYSFFRAFQELESIENVTFLRHKSLFTKDTFFINRVFKKITGNSFPLFVNQYNKLLINKIEELKPDLIFAYKALWLKGETILKLKSQYPKIKVTHFHPDNLFNNINVESYFLEAIRFYDVHFVPKKNNLELYHQYGNKSTIYLPYAADLGWHYPAKTLSNEELNKYSSDISFVGTFETDRAELIKKIAENLSANIKVWGSNWDKFANETNLPNLHFNTGHLFPEEMSKAIHHSKISLAFLRKSNKDDITARTFEIPACNTLMMHEKTDEAMIFFEDREDAVFFSTIHECIELCKFYLENDTIRNNIANNGYRRVVEDSNTYKTRAQKIIDFCMNDIL